MTFTLIPTLTDTQVECSCCKLMVEPHACTYTTKPDTSTVIYTCILCQVKDIPKHERGGIKL